MLIKNKKTALPQKSRNVEKLAVYRMKFFIQFGCNNNYLQAFCAVILETYSVCIYVFRTPEGQLPVCFDNWDSKLSDAACRQMGKNIYFFKTNLPYT
jgi:hypothetical protein